MTEPAFDELLRRLVAADVHFVLVGGLAVGAWGVVRGTKDVDIVVESEPDNLKRLAELATDLGGFVRQREALAGSARSIAAVLETGERALIETPLGSVDVVNGLETVPGYARLRETAAEAEVLGVKVCVCSLDDLRSMKRAAGRTRDLADLEDLDSAHPAQ